MSKPEIECTRVRACRWKGFQKDLVSKHNVRDSKINKIVINDMVCPKCGCKTMYDIVQKHTKFDRNSHD